MRAVWMMVALASCSRAPLVSADAPSSVAYVALLEVDGDGRFARASGLAQWREGQGVPLAASSDRDTWIAGWDRDALEARGAFAVSIALDRERLVAATDGAPRLPPPIWLARWHEDGRIEAIDPSRAPVLTARWVHDPPVTPCPRFTATAIPLDADSNAAFAFALDATTALVAAGDAGKIFRVDASGVATELAIDPPGARLYGGTKDAAGTIWVGDQRGYLYRASLEPTRIALELVATSTPASNLRWIDGEAGELYTLDWDGVLRKFDGTAHERIAAFAPDPTPYRYTGAVERIRANEVLALKGGAQKMVRVIDGVPRDEELGADQPTSLATDIAGTFSGALYRNEGAAWTRIEGQTEMFGIYAIAPFTDRDGFMFAGAAGFVGSYVDDTFCTATQLAPTGVRGIVRIGEDWLLWGDRPLAGGNAALTLLEKIAP